MIHNWDILSNKVLKSNTSFFLRLYSDYSQNVLQEYSLKDKIVTFILEHSQEFNGMFETTFNHNIENFIKYAV